MTEVVAQLEHRFVNLLMDAIQMDVQPFIYMRVIVIVSKTIKYNLVVIKLDRKF